MNKIFSVVLLCATLVLASCSKDDDKQVTADSVTIDKTTLSLMVGKTETLTATVVPESAPDTLECYY